MAVVIHKDLVRGASGSSSVDGRTASRLFVLQATAGEDLGSGPSRALRVLTDGAVPMRGDPLPGAGNVFATRFDTRPIDPYTWEITVQYEPFGPANAEPGDIIAYSIGSETVSLNRPFDINGDLVTIPNELEPDQTQRVDMALQIPVATVQMTRRERYDPMAKVAALSGTQNGGPFNLEGPTGHVSYFNSGRAMVTISGNWNPANSLFDVSYNFRIMFFDNAKPSRLSNRAWDILAYPTDEATGKALASAVDDAEWRQVIPDGNWGAIFV